MIQLIKMCGEFQYLNSHVDNTFDMTKSPLRYTMQRPLNGAQYSDVIYAIILSWPDNFILELGDVMATKETKAILLGYNGVVEIAMNSNGAKGINATLPHLPPNTPLQWAWTLKLEPVVTKLP